MFNKEEKEVKPTREEWKKSSWWKEYLKTREKYVKYVVGYQFSYLGRWMIVTKVYKDCIGSTYEDTKLICDYVDNNGVLHEWKFTYGMLLVG